MPGISPTAPQLPPPPPQPSATERFLRGAAKIMTTTWNSNIFVWLPAISTDPNSGPTYGLLPALVLSDSVTHHIRHLFAPSYTHNATFGETGTWRYYFYPTDQSQLFTTASYSQHTNRTVKIRYENSAFWDGLAFVRLEGYYNADGSLRFFGIGPGTVSQDETGYTGHDKVAHLDLGINFFQNFRVYGGVRYRRFGTDPTIINVPDITTKFPNLLGLSEQNTVVQEAHLIWDTRDYPVTPTRGSSGEMFFEKTDKGWNSDSDYIRYGLEGKSFFPWMNGWQNTVIHGLYDWVNGPNIPFYELATLGGRETLRGFGDGRFTDQGRLLFNVEQRMRLTTLDMMGVHARFEVGPFYDIGTVFPRPGAIQRKNFYDVIGGSFRAVVTPNVVGSVDVGVGKEGIGTFVGIDYPF
jgi:outer membrane protein assembly factor BamA